MTDIEIDLAILDTLKEIKALMTEMAGRKTADLSPLVSELNGRIDGLDGKISELTSMLGKSGEHKVAVSVEGADGAIQDLVSRVIEEVLIRVKQENLLEVV